MLSDWTINDDADEGAEREAVPGDDGSRSIRAILKRSRARRRRRSYTRAPDFVHGNRRLEDIYETYGARWVEGTAFVEHLPGAHGVASGWTIGRFEDGFLTLEHGLSDTVDDLEGWLEERLDGLDRVLLLSIAESHGEFPVDVPDLLHVDSSRARLQHLETRELNLTRDREFGNGAPFASACRERLLESRLDVMTLICLSVRLVAPSR